MAAITVKYRGPLLELTKINEENLNADNIKDIVKHIKEKFGSKAAKTAKIMLIAIDGESMLLRKGFSTKLKDNETVQFLPICGGG